MGILVANINKKSVLNKTKLLLEVYFTISEIKFHDADITLLAYYCLYGSSRSTNNQLKAEYYKHLPELKAAQAIHRTRYKLKNMGILIKDAYTLDLTVRQDLLSVFKDMSQMAAILRFNHTDADELETDTTAVSNGV